MSDTGREIPRIAGQDSCGQYDGNYGNGNHSHSGSYAEGRVSGGYLPDLCDDKLSGCGCTDEGVHGRIQREAAFKER